jgi:hypothetical protein
MVNPIQWTNTRTDGGTCASEFQTNVYDLSFCGRRLGEMYSSNILVRLSLAEQCLSLPPAIYDEVMSGIPSDCSNATSKWPLCAIATNVTSTQLSGAMFTFRLSEDGYPLQLPLTRFVVSTEQTKYFCIVKAAPASGNDPLVITFGATVLESFFVSLDVRGFRLGLSQKLPTSDHNDLCLPRQEPVNSLYTSR